MAEQQIIELARKAKNGDREAFEELCRHKTRSVVFNALAYVKNLSDAEDIAQEVLMLMFRSIHTLKEPETIDIWILRIIQNKCKRFLDQNRKYAANLDIDDEMIVAEEEKKEFLPEAYAQDKDLRHRLYEIVMSLPEKRREAVVMYYYDDLSTKEIAEVTGTSVQNVTSSITRARKMIKEEIEKLNAGDLKALSGMAAATSVLGRALKDEALLSVPEKSVISVQEKVFATVKIMEPGSAAAAGKAGIAAGKGIAFIVSAVIVVCGVVTGVTLYSLSGSQPAPAPPAAAEVDTDGEIVFSGGYGTDGHINPSGAEVADCDIEIAKTTWTIADESGAVFDRGEGTDLSASLNAMIENGQPGKYLLKYRLTDKEGNVLIKQ
ncbi:MAG: RNA polymerase sigma factor, partial [Clostridiales Family XIII bacterium]|nr:RNA polymerase sigma factor [Clostridiales Family XIII bacterium]